MPKNVDLRACEEKWQRYWIEKEIYKFDPKDMKRPIYSIDTPPPYPSGEFHLGNVLNWSYFDAVARFKRMQGYNVLFPQGWDCHGLPTECEVEKQHGIRKRDLPPDEFRKLAIKWTEKYINIMKKAIIRLGCSIDWSLEYRTMDPSYWYRTQLSFLIMKDKGLIYRGKHPVNWCIRCETAISDAEVEYKREKGILVYIRFQLEEGGEVEIATTRPELLPACVAVAVNPADERYRDLIGKHAIVPIFNQIVSIIGEREVDPGFGTGVVMICTYGDKVDVRWVARHKLPIVEIVGEDGRLNGRAGILAGLTIREARDKIVEELRKRGLVTKIEKIEHDVAVHDRCKTPIEILVKEQWFVKVRALTNRVLEAADRIRWVPPHMKHRLINWAKSLDWDWVISRQRIFGTPIPVWYCKNCKTPIFARREDLPVDPKKSMPPVKRCPKCGTSEFEPEEDTFDTWMDSSLTCAVHAGWPEKEYWRRAFPIDLHPSGSDIIRTWAYYLIVRHVAIFDEIPFKIALINGMVLGTDGRKMSKHLRNYVTVDEVVSKYPVDALRYWAFAGGATGSDIPFRWKDVEHGAKFLRKLYNAMYFASLHLNGKTPEELLVKDLHPIDVWILQEMNHTIEKVTKYLEDFAFNEALVCIEKFVWHVFCDHYIEAVKHRLYRLDDTDPRKKSALWTLHTVCDTVLKLLAPFLPHTTEEIYMSMAEGREVPSIHIARWPKPVELPGDAAAKEASGRLAIEIIAKARRDKASKGIALPTPVPVVVVEAGKERIKLLEPCIEDIKAALHASDVKLVEAAEESEVRAWVET